MGATRILTPGEQNLVANALFLRQETLRLQAHNSRVDLAKLKDEDGASELVTQAKAEVEKLEADAKATFNLELVCRKYGFWLQSAVHIAEQA